jgi:8-oxo-dGTP diphosphatase
MALKTHRVAAATYIFHDGKLLLLRRVTPPKTLVPPGGRLRADEDPVEGVKREVREETGLEIEILGVAHTWFGRITNESEPLLAVNYIAHPQTRGLRLSDEHSEFVWAEREQIESGEISTTDGQGYGYRREDLLEAFDLHAKLTA